MSTLVDERVVEMRFDNRDFEKNTRQSMSTIQKLKSSLNFSGVAKSVNNAVSSIDMTPLVTGLEKSEKAFSTWEIAAISAVSNITNRIVDLGIQMAKSLSIDNISAGWGQFGEMTRVTGTMIAQLTAKGYEEAEAMNIVSKAMDKFMWYADSTSFSLEQMASAADLFVQNGKSLDEAFDIVTGIGNLGASAGKSASEIAPLFETVSRIGDRVMTQQYESLRRAGLMTEEFRNKLLETAVAEGKLTKFTDTFTKEVIYYYNDMKITAENMRDSISEGWLTSDILYGALDDYGQAVNKIYDYNKKLEEESGEEVSSYRAIELWNDSADKAVEEAKQLLELAKETGDELEITNAEAKLSAALADQFSGKWTNAATEARTFKEAVDAVRDAVKTEWSRIFTLVIGDYKEATAVWSEFSSKLYDVFAAPLAGIRKMIEKDNFVQIRKSLFGGLEEDSDEPLGAIWNIMNAVQNFINIIGEARREVFPFTTSLSTLAERFRVFTEYLATSEDVAINIKNIFKGFFSLFKIGLKILEGLKVALKPIFDAIIGDSGGVLKVLGDLGWHISQFAENTTIFTRIGTKIATVFETIIKTLKEVKIIEHVTKIFKEFVEEVRNSVDVRNDLKLFGETAKTLFEFLVKGLSKVIVFLGNYVIPTIAKALPYLLKFIGLIGHALLYAVNAAVEGLKKFVGFLKSNESIQNGWKKFINFMKTIPDRLAALKPFFIKVGVVLGNFFKTLWEGISAFGAGLAKVFKLNSIGYLFVKIGEKISYGFHKMVEGIKSLSSTDTETAVDNIKKKLGPLEPLFTGLMDLFKGLWSLFKALIPVIGSILSAVGRLFTEIGESLKKTFNTKVGTNGGFNFWYLINGGIGLLIAKSLYDFVFLFNGITSAIANTIDALGSMMRAKAVIMWAGAIKTVAEAILMIVASLLILTLIDENKLKVAMKTLVTIMVLLAVIISAMGKFLKGTYKQTTWFPSISKKGFKGGGTSSSGEGFIGATGMIMAYGLAVLALVAALKIIDGINKDDIVRDLAVLAAIMGALAVSIGLMIAISNLGDKSGKKGMKGIKGILSFAIAVLILTIPIKKFGEMDNKVLTQGILAVGALLLGYALAVRIANGIKAKSMGKLVTMAAGMTALVGPVTLLGQLDLKVLWNGVAAVSVMALIFGAVTWLSGKAKTSSVIALMAVMYVFGQFVNYISDLILNKISKIAPGDMVKFGIIATALFAFMTTLIVGLSNFKQKVSKKTVKKDTFKKIAMLSAVLLAVAGIAAALTYVSKTIHLVNWGAFVSGMIMLVAVVGITVGLVEYAKRMKFSKKLIKNIGVLAILLGSLTALMLSIGLTAKMMGGLNPTQIAATIALVVGSLALIFGSLFLLSKVAKGSQKDVITSVLAVTIVMGAISAMMLSIAVVMKIIEGVGVSGTSMLMIFAMTLLSTFAILAVAGAFKDKIMDCAEAMLVLATSAAIFAVGALALAAAAALMKGNVVGLILVAGAMIALGVAAKILGAQSSTLITVAVAFAAMGIAVLAVGAAMYLIILALEKLLPMIDELAAKGDSLKTIISSSISGVLEGIANALPVITKQIMTATDILLEWLWDKAKSVYNWFMNLDLKKITGLIEKVVELIFAVVIKALEGIKKNAKTIVNLLIDITLDIIYALIGRLGELTQALFDLVIGLIDSFGEALKNNAERLRESIVNFAKNAWQAFLNFFGIHSPSKESESAASNIIAGLVNGLMKGLSSVVKCLTKLGNQMLKEVLKLPKKFIKSGSDTIKAFLNGLKSVASSVIDFLSWFKDKVLDFFTGGLYSKVRDAGKQTMVSYRDGMETVNDDVNATAKSVIDETVKELSKTEYFKAIGEEIIKNIAEGIESGSSELASAIESVLYESVDEIESAYDDINDTLNSSGIDKFVGAVGNSFFGALGGVVDSLDRTFVQPLTNSFDTTMDIIKNLGPDLEVELSRISTIIKAGNNINEASQNGIVQYIVQASDLAVYNIEKWSQLVSESMLILTEIVEAKFEILNTALTEGHDWLTKAIADLQDLIESELDFTEEELTIRPVMDISDIEEKTGQIAGMLYSVGSINVATATANAERASAEIAATKQIKETESSTTTQVSTTDEQGGVYNLTFNITGNDPKAIADEVSKRFQQYTSRRNAAYGK